MKLTKTQISVLAQEVLKEIKASHSTKSKANEAIIEQEWNKILKSKEYKELDKLSTSGMFKSFQISYSYVCKLLNTVDVYYWSSHNEKYIKYSNSSSFYFENLKEYLIDNYNYSNNITSVPSLTQIESKIILKSIEGVSDVDQLIKDIASMF